jgi:hypothetical protein
MASEQTLRDVLQESFIATPWAELFEGQERAVLDWLASRPISEEQIDAAVAAKMIRQREMRSEPARGHLEWHRELERAALVAVQAVHLRSANE